MNHREFLIKEISKDIVKKDCRCKEAQEETVSECVSRYDKSSFFDLDKLIQRAKSIVSIYKLAADKVTSKECADYAIFY